MAQQLQQAQAPLAQDPSLDPTSAHINMSLFDLLLIELVPLAERMAREYEASLDRPSLTNKVPSSSISTASATAVGTQRTTATTGSSSTTVAGGGAAGAPGSVTATATTYDGLPETEVFKDSVYFRLDKLGFRVGQGLSERFSRDRPRFSDQLDVIKFLCKDLWVIVFKKQIDNLKTNHRGVYVLTDSKFRPFSRMSMTSAADAVVRAQPHLIFPCGMIRGVLSSLGVKATVQAETSDLPTATFQIKTIQGKT